MNDNDEWELVGGVYRRKPKQDSSWIGVLFGLLTIVALLSQCSHH